MSKEIVQSLIDIFPQIIPEIILGVMACIVFLGGTFKRSRCLWGWVSLLAIVGAGIALMCTKTPTFSKSSQALTAVYAPAVWVDSLAFFVKGIALVGGAILLLFTWHDMDEDQAGEHHGCLLLITAGVCFAGCANELVTLFIALELISIPTYVLLYLSKKDLAGQEAAVKYFLLSVFSSAFLLFGFSYLYGIAGTTNVHGIVSAIGGLEEKDLLPGMAMIAAVMVIAGLGFKITAVPFHFYAPDVYQGTSTGSAALLAFVPKVAGFVALIRVLGLIPMQGNKAIDREQVAMLLWILAAVTMTLGNVLALLQKNLKRMLAYSSVAHAGYMLIALSLAPHREDAGAGVDSILFYLVSYGAMTIGAFGVIALLSSKERSVENLDDLSGLSSSHPRLAFLMSLFMLRLICMPATAGFMGKFLIFYDAFSSTVKPDLYRILALIGAINAAIAAYYYLRVITMMYLRSPLPEALPKTPSFSPRLVSVWICALATLILGLYPKPLVERTRDAVKSDVKITAENQN